MTAAADADAVERSSVVAEPVLARAGVTMPFRLVPIAGGGNNRVFQVLSAGMPVVLKSYFRHPDDPRDRLRADFGFSSFAWLAGARALPRPLASDPDAGMAVYEFIAGRRLTPGEATAAHVAEAAAFFAAVNEHHGDPGAAELPEASEACFSIAAHVACVDRRIERLTRIDVESPLGRQAAEMVASRLRPTWSRVREAVLAASIDVVDQPLAAVDRCLSPSDFGFHNALLAADGRLRFLDFEYAGHDDPAKMACDFFCQPAVPVPLEHLPTFLREAFPEPARREAVGRRAALLQPAYQIKWCCIMLNEFLPVGDRRRAFAGAIADRGSRRSAQLAKVEAALDHIGA